MKLNDFSAEQVIEQFGLKPLEGEGGYFSIIQATPEGNSIFFLLQEGDFSAWHRLKERETWALLAGDEVDLHIYLDTYSQVVLGSDATNLVHSVAPGEWMAAATRGKWSLILCYLAPAFSGMELATLEQVRLWRERYPELPELIHEQ